MGHRGPPLDYLVAAPQRAGLEQVVRAGDAEVASSHARDEVVLERALPDLPDRRPALEDALLSPELRSRSARASPSRRTP